MSPMRQEKGFSHQDFLPTQTEEPGTGIEWSLAIKALFPSRVVLYLYKMQNYVLPRELYEA